MPAHSILCNTIIGFVSDDGLLYVTKNYDVAKFTTGEIVSAGVCGKGTAVDAYADKVALHTHAVFGRDIAEGISMSVSKRDAKPSQNIGIAISTMRTNGPGKGWSMVDPLSQRNAVRLMHKWFIEHGLMDLYIRNKYTAIEGFRKWVCGELIEFFSPNNKLQWYNHVMDIDYEIAVKGCGFSECLCDTKVPSCDRRNVIPNEFYDTFGLFDEKTRQALWMKGKPNTSQEADMILHEARLSKDRSDMDELMSPILCKAARVESARLAGIALDKKAVRELLAEAESHQEEADLMWQRKEDIKTIIAAFQEKHEESSGDVKRDGDPNRGGGITWAGPVKYIDPFRGAGEEDRLATAATAGE